MKAKGPANDYPMVVEVGLVGSCTNSSYQDLARAASIARQAYEKGIEVKGQLIINPGSEQIRYTAERDGILDDFKKIGAPHHDQCLRSLHRTVEASYRR